MGVATVKRCATCKVEKEVAEFYRDSRRADGLESRCRTCCVKRSNRQNRKRKRGWTHDAYVNALNEQGNRCAICHGSETLTFRGRVRELAADHDHRTMQPRGLLCSACNPLIGHAGDDPAVLRAAAEYLERFA